MGPWVKGLLAAWTLLPWIWSNKNTKMGKFDCMAAYLNCCVPRADFHFMEASGLYYSYTHSWVPGCKGYLLHGPYFLGYDRTRTRKWLKFDCMAAYLTAASQGRISILWKPRACTIRTPICGSLGSRVTCCMDPTSLDMIAQEHENGLSSTVWKPT